MNNQFSKEKEYKEWLEALKNRIRSSQIKAAIKVNSELLELYWHLGEEIVSKQQNSSWGVGVIEQLSKDLMTAFPGVDGFSRTNLFYIRKWFLFYTTKVPQAVGLLPEENKKVNNAEFVQQLVGQIPWDTIVKSWLSPIPWKLPYFMSTKLFVITGREQF